MIDPNADSETIFELKYFNLPPPPEEWSKFKYVHATPSGNITIHFDYNKTTGEYIDFKIVNP